MHKDHCYVAFSVEDIILLLAHPTH
eukprot:COSAG01_NODE_17962_length_1111_cov_1.022727_1_plen_24_part_10